MSKVKVGVIGLGMGSAHLKCYSECQGAEIVAICDLDEAKLDSTREHYPQAATFTDYERMLAMPGLDAVSVALPNFLHAPVTIAALKAGKHVLCEKPMAMNAAEAQEMKSVAEKEGKILMMHFNMRYGPLGHSLKPLVDAGMLGEVYHVVTYYIRRDGYPKRGWFGQKDKSGGGPLVDLGVHRLDLAMWLMGHPKPVSVSGQTYELLARRKTAGPDAAFDCEDSAAAFVRFENGCTLYLMATWDALLQQPSELGMRMYGTEGSIFEKGGEPVLCRKEGGCYTVSSIVPPQVQRTCQDEFVSCILDGKAPSASAEHGVVVQKILDAIYKSAETGREVVID